jgi:hypothetical protein
MGPGELEELLLEDPFVPIRLMLASGDFVLIEFRGQAVIVGLTLYLDPGSAVHAGSSPRFRLISVPNVCVAERVERLPPARGRRVRY